MGQVTDVQICQKYCVITTHHHVRLLKSCHNATCTWKEIKIKHIKWKYKLWKNRPNIVVFSTYPCEVNE